MEGLDKFNSATGGKYDPGQVIILFDGRHSKSPEEKMSMFQSYWLEGMYRLGWAAWVTPWFEPGKIRLVWYTHAGNEGTRDYPLWQAYAVKDMFDTLSDEGFRPMVLGWSAENPYPMIGGREPPPPPKVKQPKTAKTYSGPVSGHRKDGTTPYDRVMAIIENEEQKEARQRKEEVEKDSLAKIGAV